MSLNKSSQYAASRAQLVDEVMDSYLTWRERSAAVATAYQRWSSASRDERATAFDAYVASLDHEEHAAARYRRRIDQAAAA